MVARGAAALLNGAAPGKLACDRWRGGLIRSFREASLIR